jgi:hypothetical protein
VTESQRAGDVEDRPLVFLVGAGASVALPAGLPRFEELRSALLSRLDAGSELDTAASQLAPETFMRALYEGRLPLKRWLSTVLGAGSPNAVHTVLATALARGAAVWTVNVDELIEQALKTMEANVRVASYPDGAPDADAVLLKPHGTVSRGRYLFRSNQVVRPMPRPWADRLRSDVYGADVVVVGYQGLDIDFRVVLESALRDANSITWFEYEGKQPGLRRRFSAMSSPTAKLIGGSTPSTLTPRFLDWAMTRGLLDRVPAALLQAARQEPGQPAIASIGGSATLARALLVERCGDPRRARHAYRAALFTWNPLKVLRAGTRLVKLSLYEPTRWAARVLDLSASKRARLVPRPIRRVLDRVHVTVLSSGEGQHEAALRRAVLAIDQDDPAILIARSKAARYLGDLHQAEELATRAVNVSDERGAVEEGAHAVFELTITQTFAGRFVDARSSLELLVGRDALASARWIAWGEWQRACLGLYANDNRSACKALDRARELFKADGLATGEVACLTSRLTAARLCDDAQAFEDTLLELERSRGCHGWTDFIDATIDLEGAEWACAHGDATTARAALDRVVAASEHRPIHLAMAGLASAELARMDGADNQGLIADVKQLATQHGFRYLHAHALVADTLAGRLSFEELTSMLATMGVDLATHDGHAASSAADYCLGSSRDAHQIFLPT